MTVAPGSRVGVFLVADRLGSGGMGEVYRARDTRLDRDVAIKVLPAAVAGDPERLARLQREARTLAGLNHPNIAQIFGLEERGGVSALVMELVEGPTLADRIAQGPIPLDEAIPIARQIADALESAHEQGIVHRDLKPANVKLRPDGIVKVLDFGLARAVVPTASAVGDATRLATITSPALMTEAGVILGTAAYMSPEQAKGKPVDRRADIWAFGVVLAEMLSARRLFGGETVSESLASVLKDQPTIPDAPPAIRQLLGRCLERDPRRRLRDIGEARLVLEDPEVARWPGGERTAAAGRARPGLRWTAAAVTLAAVAAAASWLLKPVPAPVETPLRKFTLPVDNLLYGTARTPQISPDGTRVVYSSSGRLWVRDLSSLDAREIVSGDDPAYYSWSPDSTHVAYISISRRQLMKVPASGGSPRLVAALRQELGSGIATTWTGDGSIIVTTGLPGTGLQRVSDAGGDLTTVLAPPDKDADLHDVSALPDGKGVLYAVDRKEGIVETLMVFSNGSAKPVLHLEGEVLRGPIYSPTGHVLYQRTGNAAGIWALPFSLDTLAPTGDPFLVVPRGEFPSVSREGTLLYMPPSTVGTQELVWVDRAGNATGVGRPQVGLSDPTLSPDGRQIALSAVTNGRSDVWVLDAARGSAARVTFGEGEEANPSWSPAGDRLYFTRTTPPAEMQTIASQAADGTGQMVGVTGGRHVVSTTVSHDGHYVVYSGAGTDVARTGNDLWYLSSTSDATPRLFLEAPAQQGEPRLSPGDRYVAYQSSESGRFEVYVKRFPSGDGKWQVSLAGGRSPRWSRTGDRIYFLEVGTPTRIMEAEISTAGAVRVGTPRVVFDAAKLGGLRLTGWDVAPDGRRFLLVRESPGAPRQVSTMTVVQNWFREFSKNGR